MNTLESLIWKIKCWKHRKVCYFWTLMGRKDKANKEYEKVLHMMDAYKNLYL